MTIEIKGGRQCKKHQYLLSSESGSIHELAAKPQTENNQCCYEVILKTSVEGSVKNNQYHGPSQQTKQSYTEDILAEYSNENTLGHMEQAFDCMGLSGKQDEEGFGDIDAAILKIRCR